MKAARDPRVVAACRPVIYGPHTAERPRARFPRGEVSAAVRPRRLRRDRRTRPTMRWPGASQAIATAPINKAAFAAAGLPWNGHTDLLAHLCGVDDVAMMFWSERLRVVLATVHIPLADVPRALTPSGCSAVIRSRPRRCRGSASPAPRLAVAGLNPHAGEHGLLGREDRDVLAPAIAGARAQGIDVIGPFPADTLFVRAARGEFDAVDRRVSRSGSGAGQAAGVRPRGQRHARPADHPDVRRSRHRVRHRAAGRRRRGQPGGGDPTGGDAQSRPRQ